MKKRTSRRRPSQAQPQRNRRDPVVEHLREQGERRQRMLANPKFAAYLAPNPKLLFNDL